MLFPFDICSIQFVQTLQTADNWETVVCLTLPHPPCTQTTPPPTPLPIGWKSRDSVPKLVEQYLSGDLKVDEFLTTTMPIESVNTAFDLMRKGKA